ncbi:hypothetical protein LI328DRAFT_83593 [Trichoderma asperelloides]|nr:hypothetical protein LI328DRAFT_83593 [Trichoderma asperelloides]
MGRFSPDFIYGKWHKIMTVFFFSWRKLDCLIGHGDGEMYVCLVWPLAADHAIHSTQFIPLLLVVFYYCYYYYSCCYLPRNSRLCFLHMYCILRIAAAS